MITVQGIEKRYGELRAVSGLNFTIEGGEIVGLLGQNGAGKTTCMKMITGYLEPTAGKLQVNGVDIIGGRERAQQAVGYLPENAPLYPEMLVEEYLTFMSELRGIPKSQRASAVDEALEATGLTDRRRQVISTLSKGYKQRVGLAQAIIHKPKILILDEPTNGLDPVQIQEIRSLIKRLGENTTILLSTHILSEIEAVCDRVLILIDGQLAADQPLEELLNQPRIRLIVKGDDETDAFLNNHESLGEVSLISRDNEGFTEYLIEVAQEGDRAQLSMTELTSSLTKEVMDAGWPLSQISIESQSLEGAFRDLMQAHIDSALSHA
jgi:ABC-2 type transport system ATP-binding protein